MPVVVTDNCHRCRFTECVAVCPVACFHVDDDMVFVDAAACIDCRACLSACPVQAIYDEDDLPDDKRHWIAINEDKAKTLPVIRFKIDPLPDAEIRRRDVGLA